MDLAVIERTQFGKKTNSLRKSGIIPAEFYGHGMANRHLGVKRRDFENVFREAGESMVITLVTEKEKLPAIVYDVKKNYLTGEIEHVDFYGVRMDEKITTNVSIDFIGEAPGVKTYGGVLNKTLSEVEVEALPGDLPHSIEIDLSVLTELDQSIYVRDLKVSDKVDILLEPETVIVTLTPPVEEEVVTAPVSVEDVKVEGEEERSERNAEKDEATGGDNKKSE